MPIVSPDAERKSRDVRRNRRTSARALDVAPEEGQRETEPGTGLTENETIWPVRAVDDRFFVVPPGEHPALITVDGEPAELPPGWRPLFVYAGFAPTYLLRLAHVDGHESTWYLDPRFDRRAHDDPETLPFWEVPVLRCRVGHALSRLWHQVLDGREPTLDPTCAGFLKLGSATRARLARFCESELAIRINVIDLAAARQGGAKTFHTRAGVGLNADVLWRLMTSDLFPRSLDAIGTGRLDWESPAGGKALRTSGGIWLTDFLFAWRVVLGSHDLAFYVLGSGHPCRVIGILFPADQVVFAIGNVLHEHVDGILGAPMEIVLMRHLHEHAERMMAAWRAGIDGLAVVFRERLISGQLWHDLTGLDQLVRRLPADKLPEIIGLWGGVPEIYGDTEAIFPETKGRIVRLAGDDDAMIRYAYEQRRLLLRTTGNYVTKNLYRRVVEVCARDPALERSRAVAAEIERIGCPLVLLGLRVENRTVEDLPAFFGSVIDTLVRQCGRVAVVIDGHNSPRGDTAKRSFASEFQQYAKADPMLAERLVVRDLAVRYKNSAVVLISTIGGPMAQSIFWCRAAHFFVTMYGTGLAKYRWACNQTGLIVTSRWTLRHQPHLRIYEADHLEDPSPLTFLPEQYIEDLPDSPQLIAEPGNPPARWNFKVQTEGLDAAIEELLRLNYRPRAPK